MTFCLALQLTMTLTRAAAQDQASGMGPSALPAAEGTAGASAPFQADALDSTRLGSGDLINVTVYNVPDLASKARVNSQGDAYLPLLDYVHLAGLTVQEAQNLIQARLSDGGFVKNPHVGLFVEHSTSEAASVLGEVAKPGVYPVLGERRLFDLISAAGGLSEKAGRSISVTHRDQPDHPVTLALSRNLADNPGSNIQVFPGDTIIVRKADIIYVVGDVGRPSAFLMDSGHLTVLQAIALAGGTTHTAKLNGARIIRKGSSGMSETQVPLKKILRAQSPDLPMQADDILFIPTSASRVLAGHTLQVALQAATAASVVAIQ